MARTGELPGTEGKRDRKLVELVNDYLPAKKRRLNALEKEKEFKQKIIERMTDQGMTVYVDTEENLRIEIVPTQQSLKIKNLDHADDEGDEE
jgi:hypothetical protein